MSQQEQALVTAFRQLTPKLKNLNLQTIQAQAKRCEERKASAKPNHLRLVVDQQRQQ